MLLYKGKYWEVIFIEECQEFPVYTIFSNNKESLGKLRSDEWQELGMLEKEMERVCQKVLNSTMFNFCCLMNNSYKDKEKAHVHFHFVPRYKKRLKLFGKSYVDKHFGYNFWKWALDDEKRQKDIFSKEEKIKIGEMLKSEFKL